MRRLVGACSVCITLGHFPAKIWLLGNSAGPDRTPQDAASGRGLLCLHNARPFSSQNLKGAQSDTPGFRDELLLCVGWKIPFGTKGVNIVVLLLLLLLLSEILFLLLDHFIIGS